MRGLDLDGLAKVMGGLAALGAAIGTAVVALPKLFTERDKNKADTLTRISELLISERTTREGEIKSLWDRIHDLEDRHSKCSDERDELRAQNRLLRGENNNLKQILESLKRMAAEDPPRMIEALLKTNIDSETKNG